jgi:oligoribonuclease NrnB/cAMP/cGMP phosphodiesterase (DHH superfamily)
MKKDFFVLNPVFKNAFDKVVHVSHDDVDGESPPILSRLAFEGKTLVTKGTSYAQVDSIVEELLQTELTMNTLMIITDISVNRQNAEIINEKVQEGYTILLIDHHGVKPDMVLEDYPWMKVEMNYADGRGTAATGMYYDFLLANGFLQSTSILEDYMELVRLYDTWEWEEAVEQGSSMGIRAKRLNDYFFMGNRAEFSEAVQNRLSDTTEGIQFTFESHIEYMLDKEQKRIDEYCYKKKKQMRILTGVVDESCRVYRYGVVFAENYQSELGNYLGKKEPEIDFIVMLDPGSKKMSLRCRKDKDVNVGEIARSLGGGGRDQTAGCPLNAKTKYLFLDHVLNVTLSE